MKMNRQRKPYKTVEPGGWVSAELIHNADQFEMYDEAGQRVYFVLDPSEATGSPVGKVTAYKRVGE